LDSRPRLLVLGPVPASVGDWFAAAEVVFAADPDDATAKLHAGGFDGVFVDPGTFALQLADYRRDEVVLSHIDKGVAYLDPSGVVLWANSVFVGWSESDPVGKHLLEALTAPMLASDEADPLAAARAGRTTEFRLPRPAGAARPFLDVTVRPVLDPSGQVVQLVAIGRNVTPEVEQQRKLDALHQAGRDLAGLDPDQLAEMNLPTRVELLKQNLRHYIRDLLHYDIIEVRLLDRRTLELKPLLEDGMTPTAAHRVLYAKPTENGVTGYVASLGRSYLVNDATTDPLYLEGATGARSSMTVPLKYQDEVVGTLNVESPRPNAFGQDDLQFTELFSKEIAGALHTLDLLTAQEVCTASQSIDAINKEVALPVDDVLGSASVLARKLEGDPEALALLQRILCGARAVKESIRKVGRELAPAGASSDNPTVPLLGKRVLVLDPDERMRRAAHLLLGRLGAIVETAGTGAEGVALLGSAYFDAVLMDIKPPDMGGYETYRRLRDVRPGTAVAMTTGFGYDTAHSIVKARADGMQYVLFKPFRPDQLVKAVLDGAGPAPSVGSQ